MKTSRWLLHKLMSSTSGWLQGRIQDFKLGGALKRIASSEQRRTNFEVFCVKNHDFTPKNHIFCNFRGGARRVPPPGSAPGLYHHLLSSTSGWIWHKLMSSTSRWLWHKLMSSTSGWLWHKLMSSTSGWLWHKLMSSTSGWLWHKLMSSTSRWLK